MIVSLVQGKAFFVVVFSSVQALSPQEKKGNAATFMYKLNHTAFQSPFKRLLPQNQKQLRVQFYHPPLQAAAIVVCSVEFYTAKCARLVTSMCYAIVWCIVSKYYDPIPHLCLQMFQAEKWKELLPVVKLFCFCHVHDLSKILKNS